MTTALLSNGGPPLDDDLTYTPPWGKNGIGNYFLWADAKKKAFDAPYDIAKLRAQRAALIGLTYDEYVLEILERSPGHSRIALMAFSPKFAPPERICLRHGSKSQRQRCGADCRDRRQARGAVLGESTPPRPPPVTGGGEEGPA